MQISLGERGILQAVSKQNWFWCVLIHTICPVLKCYRGKKYKLPYSCDHTKIAACIYIFSLLEVDCRHTWMRGVLRVVISFNADKVHTCARTTSLTYALVHSRERENYNTSRSLRVISNLCVCFLNIKGGGGEQIFSNRKNSSSVQWPIVLPHFTFEAKTK